MKIKILNEAVKTNVYKAECVLATNRDVNLTDVLNNIRALEGITIVNMVGKSRFVSKQKELIQVEMKFLPSKPAVLDYLRELESAIRAYPEIYSFRVVKIIDFEKETIRAREKKKRITKIRKTQVSGEKVPVAGRAYSSSEPEQKEFF